jgi:hypothetical protein
MSAQKPSDPKQEESSENGTENKKGLSKEAWTAVSAIAVALIGGIVTIATTILNQPLPSPSTSPPSTPPTTGSSSAPNPVPTVFPTPSASAPLEISNAILGKWLGSAKDPSGASFRIAVEIHRGCHLNKRCGSISVPEVPCYGEISLQNVSNNDYEFYVSNFDSRSNLTLCKPGAGEHFQPLSDGRLAYKATYSDAQGILEKVRK